MQDANCKILNDRTSQSYYPFPIIRMKNENTKQEEQQAAREAQQAEEAGEEKGREDNK